MGLRNFPDVYPSVVDQSYSSASTSRFRCGLIGPAEKGPINVATPVRSLRDWRRQFGDSLTGVYLANAVQLVSDISDGVTVVRIAHQYEILETSGASATGAKDASIVSTANAALFQVNDYIRVSQIGKVTTANARVVGVSANSITLDPSVKLKDTYDAANVDRSRISALDGDPTKANNAANNAESFLSVPVWSTTPVGGSVTPVTVSGDKSSFEVLIETNPDQIISGLAAGDTVKLEQSGMATTRELMVKSVTPSVSGVKGKISFEPVNRSDMGYTAISLQDSYTGAKVYKFNKTTTIGYHMLASMPGTWANSDGARTGLIVKVVPGSKPDTKKFQVFEDSGLVEEIDNLSHLPEVVDNIGATVPNPDFFATKVNGTSQYVSFALQDVTDPTSCWLGAADIEPPATTRDPWKSAVTKVNIASFTGGFNGENVTDSDYIGTIDTATELPTGLKIFEDRDLNLELDIIAAPGVTSVNVAMELDRINRVMNTASVFDIPRGLPLRQANDWSNSAGTYRDNGKLDTYSLALIWNWGTMVDSFTGNRVVVPPTCGALRCLAYTFDAFKPGWAAAGEARGLIPEFLAVEFPRSSDDAKQSSYRDGNVVNPIIVNRNRIMLFGNATTQRDNSKMASLNNVITVNTILRAMYVRGRKYLFDPLDDILLAQMYQDFRNLLLGFKNDRMIEDFSLTLDKTNNSPSDRNARQANVDFSIIPIDALEKLFVNATVRESGAVLNSLS